MEYKKNILNPKQVKFLDLYFNPSSASFGDMVKSAVASGYTESTGRQFTEVIKGKSWVKGLEKYKAEAIRKREGIIKDLNAIADTLKDVEKLKKYKEQGLSFRPEHIIKTLELLAKIEGLLVDKQEIKGEYTLSNSQELDIQFSNVDSQVKQLNEYTVRE